MIGGALPLLTALLSQAGQAPLTVDLGCGASRRASDVTLVSRATSVSLKTRCVSDKGADRTSTVVARFRMPVADREWFAALGPLSPVQATPRREGANQAITIARADGKPCAAFTIVPLVARPLPRRFLGDDGDWQATTDIFATRDCGAIAVRAGNRIALFGSVGFDSVRLGEFRIEARRRGTADGDDQRNAHHHGGGGG